jgi:hypothetical protein
VAQPREKEQRVQRRDDPRTDPRAGQGIDASLRFLLVRGRGKHFSAGADLAWMQQSAELDYHTNLDDARELAELMYNLAKLKVPTLAVVQGGLRWRAGPDQLLRHGHRCR